MTRAIDKVKTCSTMAEVRAGVNALDDILVPLLVEFTQRYPLVDVVLSVEDRMVDLIAEHIDVAIRVAHLEDSTLVARRVEPGLPAAHLAPVDDTGRCLFGVVAHLAHRRCPRGLNALPEA